MAWTEEDDIAPTEKTDTTVKSPALKDGLSLRDCDCEGWEVFVPIINGYIMLAKNRYATSQYPKQGEFKFCPWCGKKREAR